MADSTPTHVLITILRAKGLKIKGKNGTNDVYISIAFGKEKYETSVKEKTVEPDWSEECELPIPSWSKPDLIFTVYHHHIGVLKDEFLGMVTLPLFTEFNPKQTSTWYPLKSKPGQEKTHYRGELELRIELKTMTLKPGRIGELNSGQKEGFRSSFGNLLNLGTKGKTQKVSMAGTAKFMMAADKWKKKIEPRNSLSEDEGRGVVTKVARNSDPGVESDEEDSYSLTGSSNSNRESFGSAATKDKSDSFCEEIVSVRGTIRKESKESYKKDDNDNYIGRINEDFSENEDINKYPNVKIRGSVESESDRSDNDSRRKISSERSPKVQARSFYSLASTIMSETKSPGKKGSNEGSFRQSNSGIVVKEKEPIPKPRIVTPSFENVSLSEQQRGDLKGDEEKPRLNVFKESLGSFASYFNKSKGNGTPIAVASPYNMNEQQFGYFETNQTALTSPLPMEIQKRYHAKSREEIMLMHADLEVKNQELRQRVIDMELYVDNLVKRILEKEPSILQKEDQRVNRTSRSKWLF